MFLKQYTEYNCNFHWVTVMNLYLHVLSIHKLTQKTHNDKKKIWSRGSESGKWGECVGLGVGGGGGGNLIMNKKIGKIKKTTTTWNYHKKIDNYSWARTLNINIQTKQKNKTKFLPLNTCLFMF